MGTSLSSSPAIIGQQAQIPFTSLLEMAFNDIPPIAGATLGRDECHHKPKKPTTPDDCYPCVKETAVKIDGNYFHGNRVKLGEQLFIASQAPTVGSDDDLFWNGVWEKNATVLDLTTGQEFVPYYPDALSSTIKTNNFVVQFISFEHSDPDKTLTRHTYKVQNLETNETKYIQRLSFVHWPDRTVLDLELFVRLMNALENSLPTEGPLWVHCNSGIGRTGSVILARALNSAIRKGEITEEEVPSRLIELITSMRLQRNDFMVPIFGLAKLVNDYCTHLFAAQPFPLRQLTK